MTEEPSNEGLSWPQFLAGMIISLLAGGVLNIVAGFAALAIAIRPLGGLVGLIPGAGLALVSRRVGRNGFAQGMLLGACLIALVGGICGFGLGEGLNIH